MDTAVGHDYVLFSVLEELFVTIIARFIFQWLSVHVRRPQVRYLHACIPLLHQTVRHPPFSRADNQVDESHQMVNSCDQYHLHTLRNLVRHCAD
jgi:hypothetical protein